MYNNYFSGENFYLDLSNIPQDSCGRKLWAKSVGCIMNFKLTKGNLNFKVYTSPAIPASGTENDIVIISSTPMENWILSSDSPTGEPRNKGDVWIQQSVSGNAFDIMNQHDFMLAITRIYQYISGIWMTVDASRYVGGVWDVVSSAFL